MTEKIKFLYKLKTLINDYNEGFKGSIIEMKNVSYNEQSHIWYQNMMQQVYSFEDKNILNTIPNNFKTSISNLKFIEKDIIEKLEKINDDNDPTLVSRKTLWNTYKEVVIKIIDGYKAIYKFVFTETCKELKALKKNNEEK